MSISEITSICLTICSDVYLNNFLYGYTKLQETLTKMLWERCKTQFDGLVKEHFDGISGLRLNQDDAERVLDVKLSDTWTTFSDKEQKSVRRLKKWLEAPLDYEEQGNWHKRLSRCHFRAVQFLCEEVKCPQLPLPHPKARKTVGHMVTELIAWVSSLLLHLK